MDEGVVGGAVAGEELADEELVVLLTPDGRPCGTAAKRVVYARQTPYHLAFSCYVFDSAGRLLVTRRAMTKATWPGVWTNSCCGHPGPGENVVDAVRRRLRHELGLAPVALEVALPTFSYRASCDGVEENELCPVFLARIEADPIPNPDEVAEVRWCTWSQFVSWAERSVGVGKGVGVGEGGEGGSVGEGGGDLSPWARLQVRELAPYVESFGVRRRPARQHPVSWQ